MTDVKNKAKTLNITLWLAQGILAVSLVWSSTTKLFQSADKLAQMWPWTAENAALVKLTGVLDLLAGMGLLLPSLLRIQPQLTVYTAYGIITLMVAASVFHITRGETSQIGINIVFAIIAAFIAWGRQEPET